MIGQIVKKGSSYVILSETGKYLGSFSYQFKELMGFGNDFFVVKVGSSYVSYNETGGTSLGSRSSQFDKILSISGNTIVMKTGSTTTTFDKYFRVYNPSLRNTSESGTNKKQPSGSSILGGSLLSFLAGSFANKTQPKVEQKKETVETNLKPKESATSSKSREALRGILGDLIE